MQAIRAHAAESGIAVAASLIMSDVGRYQKKDASFPAMDRKWREETEMAPEEAEYIAHRRWMGAFSREEIRSIATSGSRIAQAVGGMVPAARKTQLFRFREIGYAEALLREPNICIPRSQAM